MQTNYQINNNKAGLYGRKPVKHVKVNNCKSCSLTTKPSFEFIVFMFIRMYNLFYGSKITIEINVESV